jgi:hypothetical protein
MSKVKLDVIKPWIAQKITEILGIEDDVVVEFVFNQLEAEKVLFVSLDLQCCKRLCCILMLIFHSGLNSFNFTMLILFLLSLTWIVFPCPYYS